MKKINIAFIAPESGIGGGNRKQFIYYKYLDTGYFSKFYIFISDKPCEVKKNSDGTYLVGLQKLIDFFSEHKIHCFYGGKKIPQGLEDDLRKKAYLIRNINFAPGYTSDPDILNMIISKTLYTKVKLIERMKRKDKKMPSSFLKNAFVVFNPIETSKWDRYSKQKNLRLNLGFGKKRFVLGRLARAEPSKWDYSILAVLKELDCQENYDYGFVFVGMPLLYRMYCKRVLSKSMIGCLRFFPELREDDDIASFYNSIDVFWQASEAGETFGNVIAESFCFKHPVLSDCKDFLTAGGVDISVDNSQTELVDHGVNGFIYKHPSEAISFLSNLDNEKLSEMGKRGFEKTQRDYDVNVGNETMSRIIYDFLLERKVIVKSLEFERLRQLPSKKECDSYEQAYAVNMSKIDKRCKEPEDEMQKFNCRLRRWKRITFMYLVLRKLLRIVKLDIEKSRLLMR